MLSGSLTAVLVLFICALVYWIDNTKRRVAQCLPPGPKPLPVVGNLLDLPKKHHWITYRDWAERYGSDILFIHLPHKPTIILNSIQSAIDLMEKRSKLYSDRYQEVMDGLSGWSWNMGFHPYGQRWRNTRRCFHQYFNQTVVPQYHPVQTREIHIFLKDALNTLATAIDVDRVTLTLATIILKITYGIQIHSLDDELVLLSSRALGINAEVKVAGRLWIEFFPWLRHLPLWVPWSTARKMAERYKPMIEATRSVPFDAVHKAVIEGTAVGSVAQKLVQNLLDSNLPKDSLEYSVKERTAKDATGIAYAAAIETQTTAILWFFTAMSLAPEVQRRAQAELDAVLGSRLPGVEDIPSLPYIRAILMETMRWNPVLPLCVDHRLVNQGDDEYAGYTIPSGSTIVPNIWAMLHNPVDFPEPERFHPNRFLRNGDLNPEVQDPLSVAFGFGRRICPGRHHAIDTLTLFFASVLRVFNVESTLPEEARRPPEATTGQISRPSRISCCLKPRNAACVALIELEAELHRGAEGKSKSEA